MKKNRIKYIVIVFVAFYALAASAEMLSVTVSNVQVGNGNVRVGLFNQEDEFPNGEMLKGEVAMSKQGVVSVVFKDLKAGTYAVSVFQDINGNKVIDKNFLGIPKEPYGFSGEWKSGNSSFDKSAFELKPGGAKISIKMK